MTTTALAPKPATPGGMTPEQMELIKRTVARGCNTDELALFLHVCARTGLDPLLKQIYAIKRGGTMTIQTSIDGMRVIADRTGNYAPGREPEFHLDEHGELVAATAFIKKRTSDGVWHEFATTARYSEYVQLRDGKPTAFWEKMKFNQTAKCAEALGFRKGFPIETAGVYSFDEMAQADVDREADERHPRLNVPKQEQLAKTGPPADEDENMLAGALPRVQSPAVRALESAIKDLAEFASVPYEQQLKEVKAAVLERFGVKAFDKLSPEQFETVFGWVAGRKAKPKPHLRRVKK